MSNFSDLKAYVLNSHNWFLPAGVAITSPSSGVVAIDNWPDADEPTLDDYFVGDCEEWTAKKNIESEEVFKPVGGILTRKQIVDYYQSLDMEFTVNSLRRIAMQIMFGSDTTLTEAAAEFTPLGAVPPEGLWISKKYTQDNEQVFLANFWCRVDVQEAGSGNKKLVKPKFMVKLLDADDNYMFFGDPDLLPV